MIGATNDAGGRIPLTSVCVLVSLMLPAHAATAPAGDDGQWTMPAKDYANTRFSGLEEINTQNVKGLKVAWTFSTGVNRGQEAAPIVVSNTMYVVTPYPNYLFALDLAKSGALKWKYEPKPVAAAQGVACCDVVNRGCMYWEGRIYFNTLDGFTVAVDADKGEEVWKTQLGDIQTGRDDHHGPAGGQRKGAGGQQRRGVRRTRLAHGGRRQERQDLVARLQHRPRFGLSDRTELQAVLSSRPGKNLGVTTWPPDRWQIGGGTVWGWVSYDPEMNLIFYGTGNPGSWNPELRPGDNKWCAGVFARNPDTGEAVWFYQYSPHDLFDHDAVNEHILLELPIDGRQRKVIVHPERNGYMYVLDRATGEVLSATPFVRITASKGVDLKTGRLQYNEEKEPRPGQGDAGYRARIARRQGLATLRLFAADRMALRSAPKPGHGL